MGLKAILTRGVAGVLLTAAPAVAPQASDVASPPSSVTGAYYPDVPSCPEPWVPIPAG
jgi:hypothetical protein